MTFRPSNARMPGWWQRLWRRRYVCKTEGCITVRIGPAQQARYYEIRPMGCGCGYRVFYRATERIGCHCPTLKGAMRQIKRHDRSVTS